eukprot:TRINITY_DN9252_c0_g1_i1.p1 TRINITY_DN9252_c0_g1~~TRINITY_DN9252_c0_g1_i1.p1  ORF type:complete len:337 (-),score=42.34 TRINITY_DN9252_c0_g1_i1:24-1034(-)
MPPCCCDNPCTARTFLQSVLTSNQVMFQVALLRNNLSQKLGEMILQQRNLRTDSFWSELSWFLQAHHMHGMGTDIKECGAVSGDSLCEVASKVANHAKPAQQHAARNILYILENCKSISDVPGKLWIPAEEVFVEAIQQNNLRVVRRLLRKGVTGTEALTHGLQQAVKVGNAEIVRLLLPLRADAMSFDAHPGRLFLHGLAEAKGFSEIGQLLRSHIQLHRSSSAVGLGRTLPLQLTRKVLDFLFTEEKEYGHRRAVALRQADMKKHIDLADQGLLWRVGQEIRLKRSGTYVAAYIVSWHPARDGFDEHYVVGLANDDRLCKVPFKRSGFEDSIRR